MTVGYNAARMERREKYTTELNMASPYLLFDDEDTGEYAAVLQQAMSMAKADLKPGPSTPKKATTAATVSMPREKSLEGVASSQVDVVALDDFLENIDPNVRMPPSDPFHGAPVKFPHLLSLIERGVEGVQEKKRLRQLVVESMPKQSKWVSSICSLLYCDLVV